MQEQSGQMKQRKRTFETELNGCDQSEKKVSLLESDSNRKNMNFSVKKQRKIRKHGCGQEPKTCLLMSGKNTAGIRISEGAADPKGTKRTGVSVPKNRNEYQSGNEAITYRI